MNYIYMAIKTIKGDHQKKLCSNETEVCSVEKSLRTKHVGSCGLNVNSVCSVVENVNTCMHALHLHNINIIHLLPSLDEILFTCHVYMESI